MLNRPSVPLTDFTPGTLCYCQNVTYGSEMQTKEGRPAIILGNERFNENSFKVTVVLLSHTCTNSNIHICMDQSCEAKFVGSYVHIEEIATVDKRRLSDFQCIVSDELMSRILTALSVFHGVCDKCNKYGNKVAPDYSSEVTRLKQRVDELDSANEAIKEKYAKLQKAFKATVEMM